MNDYNETVSSLNFGFRVSQIEKGKIKATIESPRGRAITPSRLNSKRCKSNTQKARKVDPSKTQRSMIDEISDSDEENISLRP